tara:strand:- start:564 stop:920 length:357 start_codon:yes stop_codon:yes gene_type:complete
MAELEEGLGLTPQEMRIVQFHNDTMASGKIPKDKDGRPMTVVSTGIKIPPGEKFAGSFVSVPGLNRKTGKPMGEGEAYKFWKKEIDGGQWPMYPSGQELNARSQSIHAIMDRDASKMR